MRTGRAEERRTVEFGEGQHRDAADERQRREPGAARERVAARRDAVEQAEVDQQFRDESVQGRQGADRGRACEEEHRRHRHVARHAAQRVERRRVRLRHEVARAEEEQRLEERVVERVEQGARETAQGSEIVARCLAERCESHPEQDDAHVLDRGVGQQTLHVVLRRGEQDAPYARGDAGAQEHDSGGADGLCAVQRADDAQDAVDARFDHHARHEGRDVRRSGRMRLRKPDVHREEAGLHAEAREEDGEERQGRSYGEVFAERRERGGTRHGVEADEAREEQHEADVRHDEVRERGAAHLAAPGVVEDQQERGDGHQLPEEKKRIAAVGGDHAQHGVRHREERCVVQRDVCRGLLGQRVGEVAARVENRRQRPEADDQDEQGRKGIHRTRIAAEKRPGSRRPERVRAPRGQYDRSLGPEDGDAGADQCQRGPGLGPERCGEDEGRRGRENEQGVEKKHVSDVSAEPIWKRCWG